MGIIWHYGEPPKDLQVRQVYAIVFDKNGNTLLKVKNCTNKKNYGMFGGKPENFDADRIATLRREFIEEANTTLLDPIYLVGYQEIDEGNGKPKYVQLRMVAMIDKIGAKQPDPDTGETYDRILTTPEKAIELLNWGEVGRLQIEEACKIAKEKFNLKSKF